MLIELKTKLKSLKYGTTDKPGGNALNDEEKEPGRFAQQPYIRKEIPDADGSFVDNNGNPIIYTGPGILGTGGPDIVIRGGALSVTRSVKDVSRLTQMFADTTNGARGIQYTVKENILSRASVKTEASIGLGYAGGFANQGVYTPLSTIGQVAVNTFGGHLNHLGLDPSSPMSGVTGEGLFPGAGLQKYESIFKGENYKNRLEQLKDSQLIQLNKTPKTSQFQGNGDILSSNIETDNNFFKKLKKSIKEGIAGLDDINYFPNENTILSYSGGPGSILGIGETSINTTQHTIGKDWNGNFVKNLIQYSSLDLSSRGENGLVYGLGKDRTNLNPFDFRNIYQLNDEINTEPEVTRNISLSPNYRDNSKNIHGRVNLGDPGKSNKDGIKNVFNYSATNLEALDKITASPIISTSGATVSSSPELNDLAQFRIAAVYNSNGDGSAAYMHFRAFIDSFSDAYTANWNPVNYVGRGDTLYNYGNFGRTINMSFTIAAQSKPELMPMYNKLNYLASTLAPDYSTNGFMRGNIIRLTVGSYIREQHGFLSSLTYDVPQESPWEIAIDSKGDGSSNREDAGQTAELPHVIKATMTFTPIHNFLPQKVQNDNKQKYILGNGLN